MLLRDLRRMFQNSAGRRCPRHPAAAASESNTTRPWSVDYWIPWPSPLPCPAKSSRPWRDPGPTWPTPSSSPPGTGRALAVVAFPLSLRVGPGRAADAREPKPRPHISSQMVILAGKKKIAGFATQSHTCTGTGKLGASLSIGRPRLL